MALISQNRLLLAEELLREAVFRARERQAIAVTLQAARPDGASPAGCGLGRDAGVVLDLTDRALAIFRELWPAERPPDELERLKAVLADWVQAQDSLDRKRNHFLRDFRRQHGFDRAQYTPEQARAFEGGLDAVNAQETSERLARARRLLTS